MVIACYRCLLEGPTSEPAATNPIARDHVFIERERHANVRQGDASYPIRGIRTERFLYLRNLKPDLWPAGDPTFWKAVGPFGDIDGGPTKTFLLEHKDDLTVANFFQAACGKRPGEELYDLENDPYSLHSVADYPQYAAQLKDLREQTHKWMTDTADPRATAGGAYDAFDKYPYTGGADTKDLGTRRRKTQNPQHRRLQRRVCVKMSLK